MPKKRLLIYAHYYRPDIASTGQLLAELAPGLLEHFEVTVICVVTSYLGTVEAKYKTSKFYFEKIDGVDVIRIRVPEFSKTSKISRIKNIISYFFGAILATGKTGKQDYVFSISQPPILGGLIGVWGKWRKKAKYIYNIQDFNPEQTIAVNYSTNKLVLKIMMMLDKFSCKKADKVIVVGSDMVETLEKRFENKKVPKNSFINNWIDEKVIFPLPSNDIKLEQMKEKYNLQDKFVIMYSGNIGLYYDLENIIKVIEKFPKGIKTADGKDVVFAFVGQGTMLDYLMEYKQHRYLENVVFLPYQKSSDLNYSLNMADVHWVVNAKGIKGVSCPSKCYGVMAAGKAVLGVLEKNSECEMMISKTNCGLCCEPKEYENIENQIKWFIENSTTEEFFNMGKAGRKFLIENLTKDISIEKYHKEISEL